LLPKTRISLSADPRYARVRPNAIVRDGIMNNDSKPSLPALEQRIAIVRDNIRQLIEQAAAFSGAEDEARNADRLAQQQDELDGLIKQRDALLNK
jgi:hypothetical protein